MKKRVVLMVIGFLFLHLSIKMFPTSDLLTEESFLQKIVFEPFKLVGALLLYILGFLAIARLIKKISEQLYFIKRGSSELPWLIALFIFFVFLAFQNLWLTVAAVGLSLFYGIMDANIPRRNRYYNH